MRALIRFVYSRVNFASSFDFTCRINSCTSFADIAARRELLGRTSPSRSATAARYGKLWSASSFAFIVSGFTYFPPPIFHNRTCRCGCRSGGCLDGKAPGIPDPNQPSDEGLRISALYLLMLNASTPSFHGSSRDSERISDDLPDVVYGLERR
jgi:hypothetical protein